MLLHVARGREITFPAGTYQVSESVKVHPGTTITGAGDTTVFVQSGNMEPLFDCIDSDDVTITNLKGRYTGGKANASSSMRGGAAIATNAVVWANGDDCTFTDLTSEDFGVCVRVDNWDGSARTARPTGSVVTDITATRPNFGVLVSGSINGTFARITGTDMQQDTGAPPHAVYVTNEGSIGTPYMTGNTFDDLTADGCVSAGFSFKALSGGTVDGLTATDCERIFSAQEGDGGLTITNGTGTALTGSTAQGGLSTEDVDTITVSNMTLRFVADPAGDSSVPGRGVVIIGDNVTVSGIDIEFPQDDNANAACLWFGASGYDTSGYSVSGCTVVNTGTSNGYAATIRNVTSGFELTTSTITGFPSDHNDTGTTAGVVWNP